MQVLFVQLEQIKQWLLGQSRISFMVFNLQRWTNQSILMEMVAKTVLRVVAVHAQILSLLVQSIQQSSLDISMRR